MNQLVDDHKYEELHKETFEHDPTSQYEPLRVHPAGRSQPQDHFYQNPNFSKEDKIMYVNTAFEPDAHYEVSEHGDKPKYVNLDDVKRSDTQAPKEEGNTGEYASCDDHWKYVNLENVNGNGAHVSKDQEDAGLDVEPHEQVKYVNLEEANRKGISALTGSEAAAQYVTM